jgi:hypothetical protein
MTEVLTPDIYIELTGSSKAVTRRDNSGGGRGAYSYIRDLPGGFLLKAIVFMVCEHEYMNIRPSIIAFSYGPGFKKLKIICI